MAGKAVDGTEVEIQPAGLLFETTRRTSPELRPLKFSLSGGVHVDFEVSIRDERGVSQMAIVRVEFPDEVRSMLEASTWTGGITIHEALGRLGAAFLERAGVGDLVGNLVDGGPLRRSSPATLHLPLSYVRSTLAKVCAATT